MMWTVRDDSVDQSGDVNLPVVRAVNRWFVCDSVTWGGYRYRTLSWMMGGGMPQNPTCQRVNVTRVFVDEAVVGVVVPDGGR